MTSIIQLLLGHAGLSTAARYTQVAKYPRAAACGNAGRARNLGTGYHRKNR